MVPHTETNIESLSGRRILTVGLPTVKIVNKIQLRLILYFELFDLENFRLGSQNLHLTPPPPPPFLTTYNVIHMLLNYSRCSPIFRFRTLYGTWQWKMRLGSHPSVASFSVNDSSLPLEDFFEEMIVVPLLGIGAWVIHVCAT